MKINLRLPYICPMNVIKQTKQGAAAEDLVRRRAEGHSGALAQMEASDGLAWMVFWRSIGAAQEARIREIWQAEAAGLPKPPRWPSTSRGGQIADGRYKDGESFQYVICNTYLSAFRSGK